MLLRTALVALMVLATAGFVVGTSLERHNGTTSPASRETPSEHAAEGARSSESTGESAAGETHKELRPLGIDVEAVPFVILAALVSLGLAAGAWLKPHWLGLLIALALAMLVFGVLDLREVVHQRAESQTGLAVLAAAIAALHCAAAGTAGRMAYLARGPAGATGRPR